MVTGLPRYILQRMRDGNMQPNLTTFNAALNARETGHIWKGAVQLVTQAVELRLTPGVLTQCAGTAAAARSAKWDLALFLLQDLGPEESRTDLVAYSTAVDACLCAKRCEPIFVLLEELKNSRVEPDTGLLLRNLI